MRATTVVTLGLLDRTKTIAAFALGACLLALLGACADKSRKEVLAYFFDDGDMVVEAGEYRGISGANYDAQDQNAEELREIRLNLVVRTRLEDARFPGGLPQELENRAFGGGPPNDGFRRRVHTTRLMLRNVGSRI